MRIEIDQSGKIEKTSKMTVIAYSNHEFGSISINGKDKRSIESLYRKIGQPNIFRYKLFAILIFILIKDRLKAIDQIIIDREYPGYDKLITNFIDELTRKFNLEFDKKVIHFRSIGKKSNAHLIANKAYRAKKADLKFSAQDFYRIALK